MPVGASDPAERPAAHPCGAVVAEQVRVRLSVTASLRPDLAERRSLAIADDGVWDVDQPVAVQLRSPSQFRVVAALAVRLVEPADRFEHLAIDREVGAGDDRQEAEVPDGFGALRGKLEVVRRAPRHLDVERTRVDRGARLAGGLVVRGEPAWLDHVVGVAEAQQRAPRGTQARVARHVGAHPGFVDEACTPIARARLVEDRGGAVGGAVVDDDELPGSRAALAEHGIELLADRASAVAHGEDDRNLDRSLRRRSVLAGSERLSRLGHDLDRTLAVSHISATRCGARVTRSLVRWYHTHWRGIAASAACSVVAAMAEAATLVLLLPLADVVASGNDRFTGELGPLTLHADVSTMVGFLLGLIVVTAVTRTAAAWLRGRSTASWERATRNRIVNAYLASDFEIQASMSPSHLQEVAGSYVTHAASVLQRVTGSVNAAVSLVVLVATALVIQPVAALVISAVGAMLALAVRPVSARVRKVSAQTADLSLELGRQAADIARHARDIRVFGAQDSYAADFARASGHTADLRKRANLLASVAPVLHQSIGLTLVVAALAVASGFSSGEVPALGAIALLLLRSLSYVQALSNNQQALNQIMPYAFRLQEELDQLERNRESVGASDLDGIRTLELRGVSYRYPATPDDEALRDVDLTLERPGVVGLVGPSGSGKSTLAQLVLRLRRPSAGVVLVNGRPADDYAAASWAKYVTLVPQEPQLIDASIAENIRFFREDISRDGVEAAARTVGLEELVAQLPEGYQTLLSATGKDLSGGQRQRIGIARALAGAAELVVLDEPTSALDAESERWIRSAIRALGERALVVLITHRDSTLSVCDRIVEVRAGEVTGPRAPAAPLTGGT